MVKVLFCCSIDANAIAPCRYVVVGLKQLEHNKQILLEALAEERTCLIANGIRCQIQCMHTRAIVRG